MNHPDTGHSEDVPRRPPGALSRLLVRNTAFNAMTQGFLLVLALACLPPIVKGLSREHFGLLTLIWAIIGYFTLMDFGISRAITKYLSEALALGNRTALGSMVWTSLLMTAGLGLLGTLAILLLTPVLLGSVLSVGPELLGEARRALVWAAISVPFMLVFGTVKGCQMALQRFDLVNIFQAAMGILQWCGSAVLVWMGAGVGDIILLTVGIRVVLALVALLQLPRLLPGVLSGGVRWETATARALGSFGGWLTVSQVVSPLFLYLDRFLIGSLLSISAVTWYSVPQEALSRLLILPISLTSTLYPALSEQVASQDGVAGARRMYGRSLKYLFYAMIPVAVLLVIFAPEILALWVGTPFARESSGVFRILAAGIVFNAIAQVPLTALHARGRPDVAARFHLLELPIMVGLNLLLIPVFGIEGAALTWVLRVVLDAVLLLWAAGRYALRDPGESAAQAVGTIKKALVYPLGGGVLLAPLLLSTSGECRVACTIGFMAAFTVLVWMYGFDETERHLVQKLRAKYLRF